MSLCKIGENDTEMTRERCSGCTVYPPNEFYPVDRRRWQLFSNPNITDIILEMTKNSLAIHVWNEDYSREKIANLLPTPYGTVSKENCTNVCVMSEDYS